MLILFQKNSLIETIWQDPRNPICLNCLFFYILGNTIMAVEHSKNKIITYIENEVGPGVFQSSIQ